MIGNRIKSMRVNKGLLQKELANELSLSQQTISLYESGKRSPDYETLIDIADYFNVTTDYLLGVSDKTTTIKNETIPEYFDDPVKAREYISKHKIFGSDGFELDDEEILEFANELLQQMKMVSYKYRK